MTREPSGLDSLVGRRTVRSVGKLLLGAASLVLVLSLWTLLPGADRLLPGLPVPLAAIATAVAGATVAGVLVYTAPGLARLARLALSGPREVVENVASTVHWLVVLAAVLVAHRGLAPAAAAALEEWLWAFDLAFLLAALVPLVLVAALLWATVDPAAEVVAERVAGTAEENPGADAPRS